MHLGVHLVLGHTSNPPLKMRHRHGLIPQALEAGRLARQPADGCMVNPVGLSNRPEAFTGFQPGMASRC